MRLENVISRLENDSKSITGSFQNNYMKLNEYKCHFMIFGERTTHTWLSKMLGAVPLIIQRGEAVRKFN